MGRVVRPALCGTGSNSGLLLASVLELSQPPCRGRIMGDRNIFQNCNVVALQQDELIYYIRVGFVCAQRDMPT